MGLKAYSQEGGEGIRDRPGQFYVLIRHRDLNLHIVSFRTMEISGDKSYEKD
jgi:hypothetical protein